MPAKSEKQRRAASLALAVKKGKVPRSRVGGSAKSMAKMSTSKLRTYARKRKRKK